MASFRRSDPGNGIGPRYSGTFLLALREALATLGWQPIRWLGDVVECLDAKGHDQAIGLENLYRRVRPAERVRWPELIVDVLGTVQDESIPTPPADLREVADRVLVRLGPPFLRGEGDGEVWSCPIVGTHIVATLVVDYPNTMSYVSEQMIADSGEPGQVWLDRAVANLRERTPTGGLSEVHAESGLLQSDIGDAYDSSRALLLDHMMPGHEADGFFVALPGRDHLLVLPVSPRAVAFLPWLRTVAAKTHRSLPYPISGELFWVRGGTWHLFAVKVDGEQIRVFPPDEFLPVLERLGASLQQPDGGDLSV